MCEKCAKLIQIFIQLSFTTEILPLLFLMLPLSSIVFI